MVISKPPLETASSFPLASTALLGRFAAILATAALMIAAPPALHAEGTTSNGVVFIDSSVPHASELLHAVKPGEEAFLLDHSSDGVDQMAKILAERQCPVSEISIVAHGLEGELELGSKTLTDADVPSHADSLATIGEWLKPGGGIAIYGCYVAHGRIGSHFLNDLAKATGANIAASSSPIGTTSAGQNWKLDSASGSTDASGPAEATNPFNADALASYPDALLPAVDGQLYYIITNGAIGDIGTWYINLDETGRTQFATTNTNIDVSFVVDTAAGLLFTTNGLDGITVRHLSNASVISLTRFGPQTGNALLDDAVNAVAVDPVNHILYVGDWGTDNTSTGIRQFTYNPANGALTAKATNGGFLFTAAQTERSPASDATTQYTTPYHFSLDNVNHKLYYADNDNGYALTPYHPVNSVYVVDLTTGTPLPQLLTTFPSGSATGGSGGGGLDAVYTLGLMGQIAVDPAHNLVYFGTSQSHSVNNAGTNHVEDGYYYVSSIPNGSTQTATSQTATRVTLSGFSANYVAQFFPFEFGSITLDSQNDRVFITNYDNGTGATADLSDISLAQVSGDGHTWTLVQKYDVDALVGRTLQDDPPATNGESLDDAAASTYNQLPILTVTGTSTSASEQGAAVILAATENSTDDGGYYDSATVQITGGTFSSNETSANDDHLSALDGATARTSGTFTGTNITVVYNTTTETLTLSGYDTIANYNNVLKHVQYSTTGDNPTNYGANTTRTISWSVNDGAVGIAFGLQNSATTTVTIVAVDDPPVNTVPGAQTALEDSNHSIPSLSISDPDANPAADAMTVTMQVLRGTLTVPAAGGSTVGGSGTAAVTLNGTTNQINATLAASNNLLYHGVLNFNGTDTLTFSSSDNGHTGSGGPLTDSDTVTITVTAVNDAPVGTSNMLSPKVIFEDTPYTFGATDFGFTDPNDAVSGTCPACTANTLLAVKITTLPTTGTLKDNGVSVTAGTFVPVTDISANKLIFTPALNANGTNNSSFTFQVQDNGGTANGGVDTDPTAKTFTFNVTAVNDPPAGTASTITILEDASHTFGVLDFGFTDPADANAPSTSGGNNFLAVTITTLPAVGTLKLSGVPVVAGASITVANIPNLVFAPAANGNGNPYTTFTFQVQDDGGTANGGIDLDATPRTLTFNVTSINDPPSGTDKTVTTLEDTPYVFASADFGFTDPNDTPPNTLLAVKITTIPVAGTLRDNSVAVTAGQSIPVADITGNKLAFTPAANANGAPYASFTFQVQDNGGTANGGVDTDATPNTMTIDVTPVNDAPAGTDKTVTLLEDSSYTIVASDFGFTDVNDAPPNNFLAVKIATLPATGTLTDNGSPVTVGQAVSVTEINAGHLIFTPAANGNGTPYASFTFKVQDDGGTANGGIDTDPTANTFTFNVTPVNDAPSGADATLTAIENNSLVLSAANFGFSDPNDTPPNSLLAVEITTLPALGTLRDNGVAVTAGQFVTVSDINAGLLVFTPAINTNGSPYASFTFQVQDNGGTANGGINLDQTANTITFNVIEPPSITSAATTTFIENVFGTFTVMTTGFPAPSLTESGALPSGVTFVDNNNGTATLSGIPASGTSSGSPYAFTITAHNTAPPNATQSFTLNVINGADLAITKTGPSTATAGDPTGYDYTVTVTDNGPLDNAGGFTVTDTLPTGVSFVSSADGCTAAAGVVTCTTTSGLLNGQHKNFAFHVTLASSATVSVSNTAHVASNGTVDGIAANNTSAAFVTTVIEAADLSITKSGPAATTAGAPAGFDYTVTVSNGGPSDNTAGFTVSDTLPAGTTFSSGGTSDPSCTAAGQNVTCAIASGLANGTSRNVVIHVLVGASVADGTVLLNTASVSATTDTNSANNSSTPAVTTTVQARADLTLAKSGPAIAIAGTAYDYTLTVTNAGPSNNVGGFTVTDVLPAGATFQTAGSDPNCSAVGQTVTCSDTSLIALRTPSPSLGIATAPIRAFTVHVTLSPSLIAGSTLANSATVASTGTIDPNLGNDGSNTVTTTIQTNADLAITKSGNATAIAGDPAGYDYMLSVSNGGPSDNMGGFSVTDTLPTGATFVSSPSGCTAVGQVVTCTNSAGLALMASEVFTVHVKFDHAILDPTTLTNTATIASTATTDPNGANNTSNTLSTTIHASADLAVTNHAASTVTAGNSLVYTITLTNNGPSDAQGVTLTDSLPAGTTFLSQTQSGTATLVLTNTSNSISDTLATMPAGSSVTVTLTVTVSPTVANATVLSDTASATPTVGDPVTGNNSDTALTTVQTEADLSITKSAPSTAVAGDPTGFDYQVTVTNGGPSDNSGGFVVTDTLPAGTTFVAASSDPACSTLPATPQMVTCTMAALANSANHLFTIHVTLDSSVPAGTLLVNTANVAPAVGATPDPGSGNNSSTATTTVQTLADLALSKTGAPTAIAGDPTLYPYTLQVTNNGPSDNTGGFTVTDTLPAGATFVSGTGCAVTTGTPATGQTVVCTNTTGLVATGQQSFTVNVTFDASIADGTVLPNSAIVASTGTSDPTSSDDTSAINTTIQAHADMSVTKTAAAAVVAGTNLVYTITVTNNGPSDAQTVALTDTLPAGTSFVSQTQTGSASFVLSTSGNPNDTLATMPAGSSTTITLTVAVAPTVANGTVLSNTANVSTATTDPASGNNSATANTTVQTDADLAITKTGSGTTIAGDATGLDYIVTVTNNGPSNNTGGFVVTDTLPAGETFSTGAGCVASGQIVTCTEPALANGANQVITIHVTVASSVASGTLLQNTASVAPAAGATPDPSAGNNTSTTVNTTVQTQADLSITKAGAATAIAGDPAGYDYLLTVTNSGPSDNAGGFTVTDVLPAGATFQTAGSDAGCTAAGQTVTCTQPSGMVATGMQSFNVHVLFDHAIANGTMLQNTASVSSTGTTDPNNTNDASNTVTTTINTDADLAVTKTGAAVVGAGGTLTYTVTVTNNGPSDAQNVEMDDNLPPATIFMTQAQTAGPAFTLTNSGNAVADTIATLASGASASFTITVGVPSSVPAGTMLTNAATVTSTTVDLNNANNTSPTVTTMVQTIADLAITKTAVATVIAGDNLVYTITVTNNGPSDAQNVEIDDTIPADASFSSQSQTSGPTFTLSNTGNVLTDTISTLPAGASAVISVTTAVSASPASTELDNTASVTSATSDSSSLNNSSTATTEIFIPPVVTINPTSSTECAGSTASFTAAASGTPTPTVQWQVSTDGGATFNDLAGATSTTLSFTAAVTENGNEYQAVFTNPGGVATSAPATLTVNPQPTALVRGSAVLCLGSQQTITATLTGTAPWHIVWSDGFTQTVSASPATRTVTGTTDTTYSITSLTDANCVGTSSGDAVIQVNPVADAAITAPAAVCAGSTSNTASVSDQGAGAVYLWTIANGTIESGAGTATITFGPAGSGSVVLTVIVERISCVASGSATIAVNPVPVTPTITAPTTVDAGATNQSASVAANPGSSYAWTITNGTITAGQGTNAITFTAGETGVVTLTVIETNGSGCASASASASVTIEGTEVVAVVADIAGAFGTNFKTSMQLFNGADTEMDGLLIFHPAGSPGSESDPSLAYSLAPGTTVAFKDLLAAFNGAAAKKAKTQAEPAAEPAPISGIGSLDIQPQDGEAPLAAARIYNDLGILGTTGMTEEAVGASEMLKAGDTGVLLAPPDFTRFRMNIGVRTLGDVTLTATVRGADGTVLGTTTHSYAATYFAQVAASDFTGVTLSGNESITIGITSGSAIVYGAITDNVTGDPSAQFVPAIPETGAPTSEILTVVGATQGAFGSLFRTSAQLYNPEATAISGTLAFRPSGSTATDPVASLPYSLTPGQTLYIADLLPAMGQTGVGSVDVTATLGSAPILLARVFDDAGAAGTTGLTEELVDPATAITTGESATLFAPIDTTAFRWNIGVRTLGDGATITVTVRDQSGNIVSQGQPQTFGPNYFAQQSAGQFLGLTIAANETATVTVNAGALVIYGSTVDNTTQDPSIDFGQIQNH